MKEKLKMFVKNPLLIIYSLLINKFPKLIKNDRLYLQILYFCSFHKKLNLNNPTAFTEKIQWLKLNYNSEIYAPMVDKFKVREIIKERIGHEYLIALLGVWDSFNEIDFDKLPNKFVLKTTHDSGGVVICKNKTNFNFEEAKRKINRSLKRNYFWVGREYPYKNVKPRIIAEEFMANEDGSDLVDYKFFCFNGEPKILFYSSERFNSKNELPKFDYYDMELNHLAIKNRGHKNSDIKLEKVVNLNLMKELASNLSKGFPHLRVDFYLIRGKVYFGELTFHHDGGMVPYIPNKWDYTLGNMIKLPRH